MKNRSKNRRHQTAYEAPEVEGEFLNESADSMLSVSDSLGNLTSRTVNEIDSSLLEEFNEDQGSANARPIETPTKATKRVGASRNSGTYVSARAIHDQKKAQYEANHLVESKDDEDDIAARAYAKVHSLKDKVSSVAKDVQSYVKQGDVGEVIQRFYQGAKARGGRVNETLKSKPYLLALGAVVAGFALARVIAPAPNHRR